MNVDLWHVAGQRDVATQDAKSAKLSRKGGAPVFSPSRLLAAVCKIAPIFKVILVYCRHCVGIF